VISQRPRERFACAVLALGRDCVLEVEDHLVDLDARGLLELPLVIGGDGQAAAATPHDHGATLTISVRRRHGSRNREVHPQGMRYLAAAAAFLGALVLLLPVH